MRAIQKVKRNKERGGQKASKRERVGAKDCGRKKERVRGTERRTKKDRD